MGWARRWMVKTADATANLPSLQGVRLALTAHVDLKMAIAIDGFRRAGAEVIVHAAEPVTTRPDVVELLERDGIAVASVEGCVAWLPTHTLEMGGDIVVR